MEASGAFSPDDFRDIASDFVCALAVVFNRKELDAKTLWSRIGSAIETGIIEAQGGDIDRFENHCLKHVLAPVSMVAASESYDRFTGSMRGMDEAARVAFIRYLSTHLYPAIVFGRRKWEERKAELEKERKALEKLVPAEGGEE